MFSIPKLWRHPSVPSLAYEFFLIAPTIALLIPDENPRLAEESAPGSTLSFPLYLV
jgi:hypothetical protein